MNGLRDGRGLGATIGVVVARSGRLASLGDPLDFAMTLDARPPLRLVPRRYDRG
ncbi:hypothetical protein [Streptomyces sp. NPDC005009]